MNDIYILTSKRLNEIKSYFLNLQNLSEEFNINNQHLKISLNPHFTTIDNVYNVNGKFIPGLIKGENIYGIYYLDDNKIIYITYKIENKKFDIYEDKI